MKVISAKFEFLNTKIIQKNIDFCLEDTLEENQFCRFEVIKTEYQIFEVNNPGISLEVIVNGKMELAQYINRNVQLRRIVYS